MAVQVVRQMPVAHVRHSRRFGVMAEPLLFETNDRSAIELVEASFGRFPVPSTGEPLRMTLIVERDPGLPLVETAQDLAPGPLPMAGAAGSPGFARGDYGSLVFRTHGSTMVISGPGHDTATIDVSAGRALGYVRQAALGEVGLRHALIEAMALTMLSIGRGYLTVHASGVARAGVGLIVSGPAGAGKSTLAVAAARRGLSVFAEDGVFARIGAQGLELWGMPWSQRLLPDAPSLFPELGSISAVRQVNGELKLELDLDIAYPGRAVPAARPGAFVAVSRGPGTRTTLEPLDRSGWDGPEVLWAYDDGWGPAHDAVAAALEALPAYKLRVGGHPDEGIEALEEILARLPPTTSEA